MDVENKRNYAVRFGLHSIQSLRFFSFVPRSIRRVERSKKGKELFHSFAVFTRDDEINETGTIYIYIYTHVYIHVLVIEIPTYGVLFQASPSTAGMARTSRLLRSRGRSRLSRRRYFAVSAVSGRGRPPRFPTQPTIVLLSVQKEIHVLSQLSHRLSSTNRVKSTIFVRRHQYRLRVEDAVSRRNRSHAMGDPRRAVSGERSPSALRQRTCLRRRSQW